MSTPPQIVLPDYGYHNSNFSETKRRLELAGSYRNQSTIMVVPTRDMQVHVKIVQTWLSIIKPMNQLVFGPIFAVGMEVGAAYSSTVETVLNTPGLKDCRYLLTMEDDNTIPPDALLKLLESIESKEAGGPFGAVGALYFTKGPLGQPMCYGLPSVMPRNFTPFLPPNDAITPCNGLGMGCTLFRMEMFKDEKIAKPWFKTVQEYTPGVGAQVATQDLSFNAKALDAGYKFACDSRVKVGHWDKDWNNGQGMAW